MELHEVQERLAAAGVLDRDVVLPGAETTVAGVAGPRQGALRVEQVGNGWEVFSSKYGLREVLCRTLTSTKPCSRSSIECRRLFRSLSRGVASSCSRPGGT